jgi:hypothetical protein
MEQSTAQRRLVKSPPELWAEVSSEDTLRRHLSEFGEIRITRTDPETTVAWEGDRASGTVELAPAGWGTKVVLTATPVAAEAFAPVAEPEPEPEPEPTVAFRSTPVRLAPRGRDPEARRGFFARLFGRGAPGAEIPTPGPPPSDPSPPTPRPDPTPPVPGPEPTPPPSPTPPIDPPPPVPEPVPQIRATELDGDRTVAILTEVLDDLGAAHHRPFSRD